MKVDDFVAHKGDRYGKEDSDSVHNEKFTENVTLYDIAKIFYDNKNVFGVEIYGRFYSKVFYRETFSNQYARWVFEDVGREYGYNYDSSIIKVLSEVFFNYLTTDQLKEEQKYQDWLYTVGSGEGEYLNPGDHEEDKEHNDTIDPWDQGYYPLDKDIEKAKECNG